MLRDEYDHERIKKRFDIVSAYLKDKGHEVIELSTEDGGRLTRLFLMIQLVDYCSYYLALVGGVDPYTITAIDFLKEKLVLEFGDKAVDLSIQDSLLMR